MAMSNLHRKIALQVHESLIRIFKTKLNRARYKNRIVGVRDRSVGSQKVFQKVTSAYRVARSYIELLHCLQTTFSAVSQICLFMIRVLIMPTIIGFQITRTVLVLPCTNHDRRANSIGRTARFIRCDTRTRPEMASSRLHTSACLSFFFSRYFSVANLLILP